MATRRRPAHARRPTDDHEATRQLEIAVVSPDRRNCTLPTSLKKALIDCIRASVHGEQTGLRSHQNPCTRAPLSREQPCTGLSIH